jgi:hypothetical protein
MAKKERKKIPLLRLTPDQIAFLQERGMIKINILAFSKALGIDYQTAVRLFHPKASNIRANEPTMQKLVEFGFPGID